MPSSALLVTKSKSVIPSKPSFNASPLPWKPHLGQVKAMKFLIGCANAVLAADPGVGKSSMVLGAFKVLRKKGVANKMLVVAPLKPAHLVWPDEVHKWADFRDMKIVVLHGKNKREELIEDADICVVNYEGLDWLFGATKRYNNRGYATIEIDRRRLLSFGFDTLVIDELTRCKHHSSGRFKTLRATTDYFARRWGLTGSLVASGLLDLFGQYAVIDGGRSLGRYITHYRRQYFVPGYDGFTWTLQDGAAAKIYERIAPVTLRLAAEDYIDMPSVVEVVREVELPLAARKLYATLEVVAIAEIAKEKIITAVNAAVLTGKLRQVANGGIYLEPGIAELAKLGRKSGRDWEPLHTEKSDAIESLVEELQGAPLLVPYEFNHDLERLLAKFGQTTPYIGSGVTEKRVAEITGAWNAGTVPLLFVHPRSAAHGLNLQGAGACHIAWHSLTWSYEDYDQLIRRLRRQGSKALRIWVYHIIAKNTIDETMLWTLRHHDKEQRSAFEALKNLRVKRK